MNAPAEVLYPAFAKVPGCWPDRAEQLWPDNPVMQEKWRRAVALVRSTKRGWVLDDHTRSKT